MISFAHLRNLQFFVLVPLLVSLAGCSFAPVNTPASNVAATGLHGKTYGGQQAIVGSVVTLYAVGTAGYGAGESVIATADAPTDASGAFNFSSITCPYANTPTYLLAVGGNAGAGAANPNIELATASGLCSSLASRFVAINEVTTAATAYAMAQFSSNGIGDQSSDGFGGTAPGSGVYNRGLVYSNTETISQLVNTYTSNATQAAIGTVSGGNTTITHEPLKLYSFANTLAACVNSTGQTSTSDTTSYCGQLFSLTPTSDYNGSRRPINTLEAALDMVLYPYQNVSALYNLAPPASPFVGLTTAPNDWTLAASYASTSTAFTLNIAGTSSSATSSSIDIDTAGNIWFPTNGTAGHGLAYFNPTYQTMYGPYATSLLHPQSIAIDNQGRVWGNDLSGSSLGTVAATSPSTATYYNSGSGNTVGPLAIGLGSASSDSVQFSIQTGATSQLGQWVSGTITTLGTFTSRPTGMATYVGYQNESFTDAITSLSATPARIEEFRGTITAPFTDAQSSKNSYTGGIATEKSVDVLGTASSLNELCSSRYNECYTNNPSWNAPQGLAFDGTSNLWIANSGNASLSTLTAKFQDLYQLATVNYMHGASNGATITTPYGVAIDLSGNVWLSNATCVQGQANICSAGNFVLSVLYGLASPTWTPLANQTVHPIQNNDSRPTY